MKKIVLYVLSTSLLFSNQLMNKALDTGLKAIPSDEKKLFNKINNFKNPITDAKVELGKKLFFDPRLSKSNLISCNTCHNLATGGVDGISIATGHNWMGNPNKLNSPTVYNAVFFSSQFWDGRETDLEKQVKGPILAEAEMAATKEHVVKTVKSMPEYVSEFKSAYGRNVNIDFKKITDTIAVFERTLVTPSKYDDFLNGDENALSEDEKKGLNAFIENGCASCHNGIALGGTMQQFEITAKYKYANGGDFKGNETGLIKVPTLRNITQTAPYFHNGAVWSLQDAIKEMGRIQLGKRINSYDAKAIELFFKALNGKTMEVKYPKLPSKTATTPKPDMN